MQYLCVEMCTALLFAVWASRTEVGYALVVGFVLIALLVVIVAYDIRHTIIPDQVVYTALGVAFLLRAPQYIHDVSTVLFVLLGIVVAASPLFVLWFVSRGAWMGFGDVKLATIFGATLGAYGGFVSVLWGFMLGAVGGVLLLVTHKLRGGGGRMNMEIPFAPFLVAGFFLVWFFGFDIFALTARIMMLS